MVLSLAQPAGLHRCLLTSVVFSIGGIHRWFSTGRGLPDASCERKKAKDPYGHFGGFLGWEIEEWCVHISVQLIGRPFFIFLLYLSSLSFLFSFFFIFLLLSFFFSLLLSFHPFLYLCGDQGAARPSRVQPLFGWTCNVFFSRGPRGLSNAPGQQPWIHAVRV